jgi:hypothetical protein
MRRALHLGVKKALDVVRSHYEVNLEAVASGYVVPEGVEDEVAMEHVDALAADAAETLTEDFVVFLFPDAPDSAVAPEGDLVFRGKPSCPLTLLIGCYLHLCCQLGCRACNLQQRTWKS